MASLKETVVRKWACTLSACSHVPNLQHQYCNTIPHCTDEGPLFENGLAWPASSRPSTHEIKWAGVLLLQPAWDPHAALRLGELNSRGSACTGLSILWYSADILNTEASFDQ